MTGNLAIKCKARSSNGRSFTRYDEFQSSWVVIDNVQGDHTQAAHSDRACLGELGDA